MPRGPKGERRPADVIGAAVKVMRIATGEESEEITIKSAAAELGSRVGLRADQQRGSDAARHGRRDRF